MILALQLICLIDERSVLTVMITFSQGVLQVYYNVQCLLFFCVCSMTDRIQQSLIVTCSTSHMPDFKPVVHCYSVDSHNIDDDDDVLDCDAM
jgi:hypothetical protein